MYSIPFCSIRLLRLPVSIVYPLLRTPPLSLPLAVPLEATSGLAAGAGFAPAIHPARSKFPGPPPPAMAFRVAPDIGEERDCFSNSARISGSTGKSVSISDLIYTVNRFTILHKLGHPKSECQRHDSEEYHRILKQSKW